MSSMTKRKYVAKEVLYDLSLPSGDEVIVKCLGGRGNNLHEVEQSDGQKYLVSMPTKFRKTIWVKRGDFIAVTPIAEGDKVKAEITRVLYARQIRHIKAEGLWPFTENEDPSLLEEQMGDLDIAKTALESDESEQSSSDDDDDADLFRNTNRVEIEISEEESSDEEDFEEDTEEDAESSQNHEKDP